MRRSSTNPDLSGCSLLALVVLHSTAFVVWWVYPGKVAWYFLLGIYIIIIIYSFTARVTGAPQVTSQPVFSFFSLFSTALWDLANSRPVHSLMLSSHLFLLLLCLLPPFTVPRKIVLARPDEREICPYHFVCVFLRRAGDLRVTRLPAGSWHGQPRS